MKVGRGQRKFDLSLRFVDLRNFTQSKAEDFKPIYFVFEAREFQKL